ncbi:5'-nucleotidase C-terminal domain-containing protein [Cytobacillus sp. BC1816]|uniref:5'-nucleotidase C-terminal domain-containing protein n=1 Tax=Cytobacillus sp. BC1816 TaxID=3440154 RepID=UPI003F51300D
MNSNGVQKEKIMHFKVTYDSWRAAGDRVVSLVKIDGTPIAAEQEYSVMVNNYMLMAGTAIVPY